jgi:hypothetical protein
VTAVDIFSGPGETFEQVGVLEMGAAAKTLGGTQDDWFPVECPEGVDGRCWVFWDYNALYSYDAIEPLTLTIPEPESLIVETIDMVDSPDGRWQAEITRSETAWLAGESAGFFYTQLTISSLEDERTWPLVGEWHAAGLGEEGPARLFLWSEDGRYLFYTSSFDYHGACLIFTNVGDYFNRLTLESGEIAALASPQPDGMLVFSPDEQMLAYNSGNELIVRGAEGAFDANGTEYQIQPLPVEVVWPMGLSQIEWSADGRQIVVTFTTFDPLTCEVSSTAVWEMDIATGAFTEKL